MNSRPILVSAKSFHRAFCLICVLLVIFGLTPAGHAISVRHRDFIFGVLIGALLEALVILGCRWTWDRVQWMKWFSDQ